jgi:hypothetical protein
MPALLAILEVLVPLLLPVAIYVLVTRWRAGQPLPPWLAEGPWPWLAGAGLLLLAAALGFWGLLGANEPGAPYTPARLEGGRLVPGTVGEVPRP